MSVKRRAWLSTIGMLLLLPGTAEAATVRMHTGIPLGVSFVSDPGDDDSVAVSLVGRRTLEFRSHAAPMRHGKRCRGAEGGQVVRCKLRQSLDPDVSITFPGDAVDIEFPILVSFGMGDGTDSVDASVLPDRLSPGDDSDELFLSIVGGEGNDTLVGSHAGDQIEDGPDVDSVYGGPGRDLFTPEREADGADLLDGGPGRDFLDYGARRTPVVVSQDADEAAEGDTVVSTETVIGGHGDDVLMGSDGPDTFIGSGGGDLMVGYGGDDLLLGDFSGRDGGDRIDGGSGDDFLAGYGSRDVLLGSAGADELDAEAIEGRRADQRDRADCGGGADEVRAQRKDRLANCEKVRRFG